MTSDGAAMERSLYAALKTEYRIIIRNMGSEYKAETLASDCALHEFARNRTAT
jgi:hypothetical protein